MYIVEYTNFTNKKVDYTAMFYGYRTAIEYKNMNEKHKNLAILSLKAINAHMPITHESNLIVKVYKLATSLDMIYNNYTIAVSVLCNIYVQFTGS